MTEPIDPTNADRYLTAFADGELDADHGRAVLHYLATHPEAASRVEGELKFRQAVGRVMMRMPAPSAALRDAIGRTELPSGPEASTATASVAPARPTITFRPAAAPAIDERRLARRLFLRRTLPLAAAASIAFLAIGVLLGRKGLRPTTDTTVATALPVPATYIAEATRTHVDCSRFPSLHTGSWPEALGDLGPALLKYLGRPVPYPDLSGIGYEYIGAGPCARPLENAAHLLYRSTDPKDVETVSLFVQKYDGHSLIQPGKVYRIAGRDAAHPMIVWRHADMVFYLISDAEEPLENAARAIKIEVPA